MEQMTSLLEDNSFELKRKSNDIINQNDTIINTTEDLDLTQMIKNDKSIFDNTYINSIQNNYKNRSKSKIKVNKDNKVNLNADNTYNPFNNSIYNIQSDHISNTILQQNNNDNNYNDNSTYMFNVTNHRNIYNNNNNHSLLNSNQIFNINNNNIEELFYQTKDINLEEIKKKEESNNRKFLLNKLESQSLKNNLFNFNISEIKLNVNENSNYNDKQTGNTNVNANITNSSDNRTLSIYYSFVSSLKSKIKTTCSELIEFIIVLKQEFRKKYFYLLRKDLYQFWFYEITKSKEDKEKENNEIVELLAKFYLKKYDIVEATNEIIAKISIIVFNELSEHISKKNSNGNNNNSKNDKNTSINVNSSYYQNNKFSDNNNFSFSIDNRDIITNKANASNLIDKHNNSNDYKERVMIGNMIFNSFNSNNQIEDFLFSNSSFNLINCNNDNSNKNNSSEYSNCNIINSNSKGNSNPNSNFKSIPNNSIPDINTNNTSLYSYYNILSSFKTKTFFFDINSIKLNDNKDHLNSFLTNILNTNKIEIESLKQQLFYYNSPLDYRRKVIIKSVDTETYSFLSNLVYNYYPVKCPYKNHYQNYNREKNENETNYKSDEFISNNNRKLDYDNCCFSHNLIEELYHPLVYKTKLCNYGKQCELLIIDDDLCPFIHLNEDLITSIDASNKSHIADLNKSNNARNIEYIDDQEVDLINEFNNNASLGFKDYDNITNISFNKEETIINYKINNDNNNLDHTVNCKSNVLLDNNNKNINQEFNDIEDNKDFLIINEELDFDKEYSKDYRIEKSNDVLNNNTIIGDTINNYNNNNHNNSNNVEKIEYKVIDYTNSPQNSNKLCNYISIDERKVKKKKKGKITTVSNLIAQGKTNSKGNVNTTEKENKKETDNKSIVDQSSNNIVEYNDDTLINETNLNNTIFLNSNSNKNKDTNSNMKNVLDNIDNENNINEFNMLIDDIDRIDLNNNINISNNNDKFSSNVNSSSNAKNSKSSKLTSLFENRARKEISDFNILSNKTNLTSITNKSNVTVNKEVISNNNSVNINNNSVFKSVYNTCNDSSVLLSVFNKLVKYRKLFSFNNSKDKTLMKLLNKYLYNNEVNEYLIYFSLLNKTFKKIPSNKEQQVVYNEIFMKSNYVVSKNSTSTMSDKKVNSNEDRKDENNKISKFSKLDNLFGDRNEVKVDKDDKEIKQDINNAIKAPNKDSVINKDNALEINRQASKLLPNISKIHILPDIMNSAFKNLKCPLNRICSNDIRSCFNYHSINNENDRIRNKEIFFYFDEFCPKAFDLDLMRKSRFNNAKEKNLIKKEFIFIKDLYYQEDVEDRFLGLLKDKAFIPNRSKCDYKDECWKCHSIFEFVFQ